MINYLRNFARNIFNNFINFFNKSKKPEDDVKDEVFTLKIGDCNEQVINEAIDESSNQRINPPLYFVEPYEEIDDHADGLTGSQFNIYSSSRHVSSRDIYHTLEGENGTRHYLEPVVSQETAYKGMVCKTLKPKASIII